MILNIKVDSLHPPAVSYRIPFLLDSLHKHKFAGLEEALSVSHWRSHEAVEMFAQVEAKIAQRLKRRNMQRTVDEWPGKSGRAELMLQKKTEACRIISSMTGRSRQQGLEFWGSCSEEGKHTKKGYMGYQHSCCSVLFNSYFQCTSVYPRFFNQSKHKDNVLAGEHKLYNN